MNLRNMPIMIDDKIYFFIDWVFTVCVVYEHYVIKCLQVSILPLLCIPKAANMLLFDYIIILTKGAGLQPMHT